MSIYGIGSQSTSSAQSLASLLSQSTSTDTDTTSVTGSASPATSTHVSGPGQLLSKLKQLQEKDPEKFKQVVSEIADKIKTLAKNQTDTTESAKLTQLADKFEKASQSGDLSSLQPPTPPDGQGGPPPPDGADPSSDSQSSDSQSSTSQALKAYGKHEHKGGSHKQLDAIFDSVSQEITAALQ